MAGMDLGTARIKVQADTQEAQNNLSKLKSTGESLSSAGKAMMPFSVAIGGIGLASIKASADAQEMQSKFNTVFGELSKEAEKWSNTYADAIGRSKYEIQEAISNQADLYVGMGMTSKEALELSKNATSLAYDLASFNNVSDDRAIEAMTKAMMGETESMKMLGVNLSETIMEQSEFVKSTGKSWKEMTLAEKATARYHEALKQSPNAFGDAERTAQGFTNQVKAMKGNFHELSVAIGNVILPLLEPLIRNFNKMLSIVTKFAEENPKLVGTLVEIAGALALIPPVLLITGKLMTFFATASAGTIAVIGGVAGAIALLGTAFLPLNEIMPNVVNNFSSFMTNLVNKVIEFLPQFTQKAIEIINAFFTGFVTNFPVLLQGFISMIGQLVQGIWTMLPHFLSSAGQIIMALFNGLVTNAPKLVGKIADIMVQLVSKIAQNLPQFLQKGIDLVVKLISGIGQKAPEMVSKFFQMISNCLKEIGKRLPEFMSKGMEIVLKIIDGLWKNKGQILSAIGDLIKGVIKSAGEAIKGFLDIGKNIVNNIKQGISGAWSGLTNWVSGKLKNIPVIGGLFKSVEPPEGGILPEQGIVSPFTRDTSLLNNPALFGATIRKNTSELKRNSQESDKKVDKMIKAIDNMSKMLEGGKELNINVPVMVDGKQIARASARYMESELTTINNRKSRLAGSF
ncbi:MAG: hypothetical protein [Bacteriophage sp.]|nr:MAG: hypothetical protein [Bacteriophage sp.]